MFEGQKVAVFDCEIKKPIDQCSRGWSSHDEMGVSVMVVWDYATQRFRVFDDKNIEEGLTLLCSSKLVVGFNTVGFDWKLLKACYPEQLERLTHVYENFDVLREIWINLGLNPDHFVPQTHGGYKLDDVALETIGQSKSGDGAHAPVLYQEGRITELVDYCIQDVKVERDLFEFVLRYGYIVRNGRRLKIATTGIRDIISW